jgi:hypothetical protein
VGYQIHPYIHYIGTLNSEKSDELLFEPSSLHKYSGGMREMKLQYYHNENEVYSYIYIYVEMKLQYYHSESKVYIYIFTGVFVYIYIYIYI